MLKKLFLEQFRNYTNKEIDFTPGINLFHGKNGQGKTNILEAIYLLSLGKSFRVKKREKLIFWECEYCRIKGIFENENTKKNNSYEFFIGKPPLPKVLLKKNEVVMAPLDFLGEQRVVLFEPSNLNMFILGPEARRRYLDEICFQSNKEYLIWIKQYRNVLNQRNHLIKSGKIASLEVWDEFLCDLIVKITSDRAKFIVFLQENIESFYEIIANESLDITINLLNNTDLKAIEILNDVNTFKSILLQTIKQNLPRDLEFGYTTIGSHRDDLTVFMRKKPINSHISRGELRSIVLTLKLLELKYLVQVSPDDNKPILLLDDVFSELDPVRRKKLIQSSEGLQTIISSVEPINF